MHNFVSAYQEMADEELMELATQFQDLTPEAQTALHLIFAQKLQGSNFIFDTIKTPS